LSGLIAFTEMSSLRLALKQSLAEAAAGATMTNMKKKKSLKSPSSLKKLDTQSSSSVSSSSSSRKRDAYSSPSPRIPHHNHNHRDHKGDDDEEDDEEENTHVTDEKETRRKTKKDQQDPAAAAAAAAAGTDGRIQKKKPGRKRKSTHMTPHSKDESTKTHTHSTAVADDTAVGEGMEEQGRYSWSNTQEDKLNTEKQNFKKRKKRRIHGAKMKPRDTTATDTNIRGSKTSEAADVEAMVEEEKDKDENVFMMINKTRVKRKRKRILNRHDEKDEGDDVCTSNKNPLQGKQQWIQDEGDKEQQQQYKSVSSIIMHHPTPIIHDNGSTSTSFQSTSSSLYASSSSSSSSSCNLDLKDTSSLLKQNQKMNDIIMSQDKANTSTSTKKTNIHNSSLDISSIQSNDDTNEKHTWEDNKEQQQKKEEYENDDVLVTRRRRKGNLETEPTDYYLKGHDPHTAAAMAAKTIQNQWKKIHMTTDSKQQQEPEGTVSSQSIVKNDPELWIHKNSRGDIHDHTTTKEKKKMILQQGQQGISYPSVPAPTQEVRSWIQNMGKVKQRQEIVPGMRVKVIYIYLSFLQDLFFSMSEHNINYLFIFVKILPNRFDLKWI